jgi:4-hydroxy-tetrahydrodipicolinate reductase
VARGGDIVGDHTVYFAGPASASRSRIALRAARRTRKARCARRSSSGKPPGLYDMQDVLGLK